MDLQQKSHFNWRNFLVTYFISYGQIAFGYPASIISTTLGNQNFQVYMGLVDPQTGLATNSQNSVTGATNGVFQAGALINTFVTCWVLEKLGRKNAFHYNAVVGLLGGSLLCGSKNIGMFLAGRFFTGMSSWGFLIATPVFTSEIAPPNIRGFFGYYIAAAFGRAFATSPSPQTQWRAPLGLYLIFPLLMILIMFLTPESPRWLLMQGRVQEAQAITYKLHTVNNNSDFARREFEQMQKQAEIDRTLETSWMSMLTKKSYRKRLMICCFFCFIGQSTAVLVINNYGPTFYKALGYGSLTQIDFQVGWVALAPPFCLLGATLLDVVGRRPLLLFGIGGCCICLCVEAAAVAQFVGHEDRTSIGKLGVAALYLFNVCYNLGVDTGGNVFYAEVFPNHIRDKGVSITNAVLAVADLVYLQVTALAFANIGYKFFLVFITISAVGFVVLFFVLPETKGIPLEEMGKLFGDENEIAIYNLEDPSRDGPLDEKQIKVEK